jgi:N-ethylmaleimide reductase
MSVSENLSLLQALTLGSVELKNRMVMAPLTRMRAIENDVPNPLAVEYYAQRASAGLIISEATQVSPLGKGYPATPGIYSPEQTTAWANIVKAVHQKGGKIFAQLWHVGRTSHSSFHEKEGLPISPSAIKPEGKTFTNSWAFVPYETPREMTVFDIEQVIEQFYQAALNAKQAGFDGVEIHSANGYLLDQFLQSKTNHRIDEYGGSFENRTRLLNQILNRVTTVFDSSKVGVRLSPYGTFGDIAEADPIGLFTYVIEALNHHQIAYLHLIEPRSTSAGADDKVATEAPNTSSIFRTVYKGLLISAGGFDRESGEEAIKSQQSDAIAYGRLYISNPDLVERFAKNIPLTPYDRKTFYGGNELGYTDYPSHEAK